MLKSSGMFHFKLLELESELLAKELAGQEAVLTADCEDLLQFVEAKIGVKLADSIFKNWHGWLTYRRQKNALVIARGRSFIETGIFPRHRAGLDIASGLDTITEYQRGFDLTPPQELNHLLINFRLLDPPHILVWYGENIAPYQLYFEADAVYENEQLLKEALTQGCIWILTKPKEMTLSEFLKKNQV